MGSDAPSRAQEHVTPETVFGVSAGRCWRIAVEATHAFAQATGCPAGDNVFDWFGVKSDEYRAALVSTRKDGSSPQNPIQQGEET